MATKNKEKSNNILTWGIFKSLILTFGEHAFFNYVNLL